MTDEAPRSSPKRVARPLAEVRQARGEKRYALQRAKVATLRAYRRVRADRAFGVLGVVVLVAVVALIYVWPKPTSTERKFGIDWPEELHDVGSTNKTLAEGTSADLSYRIDEPNITLVAFWLFWKDDIGDENIECDNFTLELTGPADTKIRVGPPEAAKCGGRAGANISYSFPVSDLPSVTEVPARNEAQARQALGDRTNKTGMGEWKFRITLTNAGDDYKQESLRGRPCPQAVPNYCTPDPGNWFVFHFEYSTYQAVLKKLF